MNIMDVKSPEQIKSNVSVVKQEFRHSIKESANSLPPAQGVLTDEERKGRNMELPTDQEVLGSNIKNLDLPKEDEVDEEVADEVLEPIEVQSTEKVENEKAKKDKEAIALETIEDFEIDNEDDKEFLKKLYDGNIPGKEKADVAKEGVKPVVDEKEIEEKYKPYISKAKEYEEVLNDPLTKALIEFRKSGKSDLNEFAKEVGFVNVEAMSDVDIITAECRREGLTDEQIESELESFNSMSELQKKKHIKSVKNEMIQERDEKLKSFTAGNEQARKVYAEAARVGKAQLEDLMPKMTDKKYEGLLITPEMAKSIEQYVIERPEPIYKDGQFVGFDIKTSIDNAVTKLYKNEWKKSLIELGRTLGADKALSARIRPNRKEATSAVVPLKQTSEKDIFESSSQKMWDKRLGKKGLK